MPTACGTGYDGRVGENGQLIRKVEAMKMTRTIVGGVCLLAAMMLFAGTARAGAVGQCIKAGKTEYVDCKGGCQEDFQVAKDACLDRDHAWHMATLARLCAADGSGVLRTEHLSEPVAFPVVVTTGREAKDNAR